MKKTFNFELLAKELDARAFAELLDNNNIDFGWEDVDDISNPNEGTYHISVGDKYYLFLDGKLDTITEGDWINQ
jgi:hypothetical protein